MSAVARLEQGQRMDRLSLGVRTLPVVPVTPGMLQPATLPRLMSG